MIFLAWNIGYYLLLLLILGGVIYILIYNISFLWQGSDVHLLFNLKIKKGTFY